MSLLAGLAACKDKDEGSPHPPALSNPSLSSTSAAVNDGGGSVTVGFQVDVSDAGADVNRIVIAVRNATGAKVDEASLDLTNPPNTTQGTVSGFVSVRTTTVGEYAIGFQVFDAAGASSNVVQATFSVLPANPAPTLVSMSPTSAVAGGTFTLTVQGSGFMSSSQIVFNGYWLTTTYVSETTLEATVLPYDLPYSGPALVTVFNPPPGGGLSSPLTFTVDPGPQNPVPTLASISPTSAVAGGTAFTLTVTGSGFMASSHVLWNSSWLTTTYVSETTLQAFVSSYETSYSGTAQVAVLNPAPGGGISSALPFTIDPAPPRPVPSLTSISPASADAGGPAFTLTVTGTGFVPSSYVQWNSYGYGYVTTTFVDSTTLSALVSADRLAMPGTATVTVYTPSPGGGTSSPATFTITMPSQPGVTVVPLQAKDLVWDPYQRKIYLSVPSVSPVHPNTITELDPFTGQLGSSWFAGSDPGRLALSDDGRFLYVALGGASFVNRFTLPDLASGLEIPLGRHPTYGPYFARELEVAPGAPSTVAVQLGSGPYSWNDAVAVFDGAVARSARFSPQSGSLGTIQWGPTASNLYAAAYGDLYALSVDAAGVSQSAVFTRTFNDYSSRIHFDGGSGLLYSDSGLAIDPLAGVTRGTFPTAGLYSPLAMVPDSSVDSAFFAGVNGNQSFVTLRAYQLDQYYQTRSTTLSYLQGNPARIVRFGADGLALLLPAQVVLVRGAFVLPESGTANPLPGVTSLTPSSAAAGGANFRVTVTGTGFVPGSIVRWNGSDRSTRYVSATELTAFLPASDVAAAGSAQVVVASPPPGGGTSDPATFTVVP